MSRVAARLTTKERISALALILGPLDVMALGNRVERHNTIQRNKATAVNRRTRAAAKHAETR